MRLLNPRQRLVLPVEQVLDPCDGFALDHEPSLNQFWASAWTDARLSFGGTDQIVQTRDGDCIAGMVKPG